VIDLVFVLATIGFFGACLAYAAAMRRM